jgi:hypothetical protein
MTLGRDEVRSFLGILAIASSPRPDAIEADRAALTHPAALLACATVLSDISGYDELDVARVFAYLQRVQRGSFFRQRAPPNLPSLIACFTDLAVSSLRAESYHSATLRSLVAHLLSLSVDSGPLWDFISLMRTFIFSADLADFAIGVSFSKSVFSILVVSKLSASERNDLLAEFQMAVFEHSVVFEDQEAWLIGKRILHIWARTASLFWAQLLKDERTVATVMEVMAGNGHHAVVRAGCRAYRAIVEAIERPRDNALMLCQFLDATIPCAIRDLAGFPTAFPNQWCAIGAPLFLAVVPRIPANLLTVEFRRECLSVALSWVQIMDASDLEENPTTFYGMAYGDPADSNIDHPRLLACNLFDNLAVYPDKTLQFLEEQPYSEGLMHLVGRFAHFARIANLDAVRLVRAFFQLQLPLFDHLTRLIMAAEYVEVLTIEERAFLQESALKLMQTVLRFENPEHANRLFFTVGCVITEKLIEVEVPVMTEQVELLARFVALDITVSGVRVLRRVAPELPMPLVGDWCDRLCQLSELGFLRSDDRREFTDICKELQSEASRGDPNFPWERLLELMCVFIVQEPGDMVPDILRVTAAAMPFTHPAIAEMVGHLVSVLDQSSRYAIYVEEIAAILVGFICAHPDWLPAIGWPEPLFTLLMSKFSDPNAAIEDLIGIGHVYSALIQSRLACGDVLHQILLWAMELLDGDATESTVMGYVVIASALATFEDTIMPVDIYREWIDLIQDYWFGTPYLRLLTLSAFRNAAASGPDVAELVGPIMTLLLTDQLKADAATDRERARLFGMDIEFPIVAEARTLFPDFVVQVRALGE